MKKIVLLSLMALLAKTESSFAGENAGEHSAANSVVIVEEGNAHLVRSHVIDMPPLEVIIDRSSSSEALESRPAARTTGMVQKAQSLFGSFTGKLGSVASRVGQTLQVNRASVANQTNHPELANSDVENQSSLEEQNRSSQDELRSIQAR